LGRRETFRLGVDARLAQSGRLRLAAAFGHRSAKFAKSKVTQSQAMIWKVNFMSAPLFTKSRRNRIVTKRLTISTTNMTGLLIMRFGSSLRNEPQSPAA